MVDFVPFEYFHLQTLDVQPEQASQLAKDTATQYQIMLESPIAYTALVGGVPVACGGLIPVWSERAIAWSFLGASLRPHMNAVHRFVFHMLDTAPVRRLEAWVRCDHTAGHRWMELLGFVCEAQRMRAFMADGADYALYAKVK